MKKTVKKAKKVEKKVVKAKKPLKLVKASMSSVVDDGTTEVTAQKVVKGKLNLAVEPLDCETCKGIGLARPDFVASPICEVCKGTGKQN